MRLVKPLGACRLRFAPCPVDVDVVMRCVQITRMTLFDMIANVVPSVRKAYDLSMQSPACWPLDCRWRARHTAWGAAPISDADNLLQIEKTLSDVNRMLA